jgi:hypothetical protein
MDQQDIRTMLEKFNQRQYYQFVWLSCVRVLPFLSLRRGFDYWLEAKRQTHLYSIFNALDVIAWAAFGDNSTPAEVYNLEGVASADRDIMMGDHTDLSLKAAHHVTHAIHIATTNKPVEDIVRTVNIAANCARDNVISEDITAIMDDRINEYNLNVPVYRNIWNNFQEDLKSEKVGCAYWARYYENIFNNGFGIGTEQLRRHFDVPNDIKSQGAAAVGRYLEGLGSAEE